MTYMVLFFFKFSFYMYLGSKSDHCTQSQFYHNLTFLLFSSMFLTASPFIGVTVSEKIAPWRNAQDRSQYRRTV
jgi:hypothetical protein